GEEREFPAVARSFEDEVIVNDVGDAGEGGGRASALQFETALQEAVAEFAADVFVLAIADESAQGGAGLEACAGGAGSTSDRHAFQKTAAAAGAEFPLLRETCRGGSGEDQERS